jgi:hypothetical protein
MLTDFWDLNFPHSISKKETKETKKADKSEDLGVCELHTAPHLHKEKKNFSAALAIHVPICIQLYL